MVFCKLYACNARTQNTSVQFLRYHCICPAMRYPGIQVQETPVNEGNASFGGKQKPIILRLCQRIC